MKIKDIHVGNYVLSKNPDGKLEYKKVTNVFNNGKQTVYSFTLKSGGKIISTFDHKVLTEFDTFEPIGSVKKIKTLNGIDEVSSCEQLGNQQVYDIEVSDNHNFVVNHCFTVQNCRAGSQTPFSSINYGTGCTEEQRMIINAVLDATDAGLGMGETPIFPVQIFRVHDGVNSKPGDPNYDLFQKACAVSAKRLFPNFEFLDVPYNLQYYKPGHPETEIAVMGCRTRVIGNVIKANEVYPGRGNFSFTTINLPRLGIEAKGNWDKFYTAFDAMIDLAKNQLLDRFEFISHKHVYNYPFLLEQGVWVDSEKLNPEDEVGEILKNCSISIGFIGLAECLKAMLGKHHGESSDADDHGYKIIKHLRDKTDGFTKSYNLNFSTFASPAEGLSGRFVKLDKKKYGVISGVTDREYYTNSFHVPVYYSIKASDKMRIEGKYHELCNAGAITYIEADGDMTANVPAFEALVHYAKKCGISYFSINHAVDRCPVCGYTGVIGDECPRCGFREGVGTKVERLRGCK